MGIDEILSLTFRLGMALVYFGLFLYFYKQYQNGKKAGFKNAFFQGNMILFFILIIFHVLYGGYEVYMTLVDNYIDVKDRFPWYPEGGLNNNILESLSQQIRPLYLAFYCLMNIVLAAQVYPLENAINWKKNTASKIMVIFGCSVWINFIPVISYTYFAFIPLLLAFFGLVLGIILNLGVNIKLFKNSTGAIRERSFYAILAFFFLFFGITVAMEVGWFRALSDAITYDWEVVIGSSIQIIAVFLYRLAFPPFKS